MPSIAWCEGCLTEAAAPTAPRTTAP